MLPIVDTPNVLSAPGLPFATTAVGVFGGLEVTGLKVLVHAATVDGSAQPVRTDVGVWSYRRDRKVASRGVYERWSAAWYR
jgi:hypothetical protein